MTQASSGQRDNDRGGQGQPAPSYAAPADVSKALAGLCVAVVGAGIVGTVCARVLAEAGASVTVVDRGEPAGGASGVPLCAMHPWTGIRPRRLSREQLSAWQQSRCFFESRVPDALHSAPWLLRLPPNERTADIWRSRFESSVPDLVGGVEPARWLSSDACVERQPGLGDAAARFGGLFIPRVPLYDSRRLCEQLLVHERIECARGECRPGPGGEPELAVLEGPVSPGLSRPDLWVVAVGSLADQWAAERVLKPMRGEVLLVEVEAGGSPVELAGILGFHSHVTPVSPGRWMLSATYEERSDRCVGEGAGAGWARLLGRLQEVLPRARVRVVGAWSGVRPVPADLGSSRGGARLLWRPGATIPTVLVTGTASRGYRESPGLANALLGLLSGEKWAPKNDETPS